MNRRRLIILSRIVVLPLFYLVFWYIDTVAKHAVDSAGQWCEMRWYEMPNVILLVASVTFTIGFAIKKVNE